MLLCQMQDAVQKPHAHQTRVNIGWPWLQCHSLCQYVAIAGISSSQDGCVLSFVQGKHAELKTCSEDLLAELLLTDTHRESEGIPDCLCHSGSWQQRWQEKLSVWSPKKDREDAVEILWQVSLSITVYQGLHA